MELPGIDEYLSAMRELLVAAASGGWGGMVSLSGVLLASLVIYIKVQKLYKKYIVEENKKRSFEAQAKNL